MTCDKPPMDCYFTIVTGLASHHALQAWIEPLSFPGSRCSYFSSRPNESHMFLRGQAAPLLRRSVQTLHTTLRSSKS